MFGRYEPRERDISVGTDVLLESASYEEAGTIDQEDTGADLSRASVVEH